jgi:hypothetical protein
MSDYCTITPTRPGERKPLFEFCVKQLAGLTNGNNYIMNDPVKSSPDLVPRIKSGIELAKKDGFSHAFIVEDDDFYVQEHFKNKLDFDFLGYNDTTYYNLRNQTYETFKHPRRSSLFVTAFKIEALEGFNWPADNVVFLDIALWKFAKEKKRKVKLLSGNPCIGIKHSIGLCGGKGHRITMRNKDHNLSFLRSRVDDQAFEFYTKLMLTL